MPKYIIDTDLKTCLPYTETTSTESYINTMLGILQANRGVKEYEGIVAEIQKWYYGSLVKASWCATCLSYLLEKAGIKGHKSDNVNKLRVSLSQNHYYGTYYEKNDIPVMIKRGDILFWLWNGNTMLDTSSKHVGIAEYDSSGDKIYCVGGNQKDKICTLEYERKYLYAIYRLRG